MVKAGIEGVQLSSKELPYHALGVVQCLITEGGVGGREEGGEGERERERHRQTHKHTNADTCMHTQSKHHNKQRWIKWLVVLRLPWPDTVY